MLLRCLAVALHDVDGPIRCQTGERIRFAGIGAYRVGRIEPALCPANLGLFAMTGIVVSE